MLTVNHFRILKNIHKCHLKQNDKNSAEAIKRLYFNESLDDEETNSNIKISKHNSWI